MGLRFDFRHGKVVRDDRPDDGQVVAELDLTAKPEEIAKQISAIMDKALAAGKELGMMEERKRISKEFLEITKGVQDAALKMSLDTMKVLFPDLPELPDIKM